MTCRARLGGEAVTLHTRLGRNLPARDQVGRDAYTTALERGGEAKMLSDAIRCFTLDLERKVVQSRTALIPQLPLFN